MAQYLIKYIMTQELPTVFTLCARRGLGSSEGCTRGNEPIKVAQAGGD